MTCIVGFGDGQDVWIGADSASMDDHYNIRSIREPKVFSLPIGNSGYHLLIGYTTSFRMGQILRHHVEMPGDHMPVVGYEQSYLIKHFIPLVRSALRDHGFTKVESNQEEGGSFLVGLLGRVFMVASDFHVNESLDGYEAIGCGGDFALGAFWAAKNALVDPEMAIKQALQAAAHFSGAVTGPFHIFMLPSQGRAEKVQP